MRDEYAREPACKHKMCGTPLRQPLRREESGTAGAIPAALKSAAGQRQCTRSIWGGRQGRDGRVENSGGEVRSDRSAA